MNEENKLQKVVTENNLSEEKVQSVLNSFSDVFSKSKDLVTEARSIVVADEKDIGGMEAAREKRLELKRIRVDVEKTRKELKEQSLREGRAIDGVANIIKALIVPVEEHLEKQEKYAENKEKERIEKRFEERVDKLSKYVDDPSIYTIRDMTDDGFNTLLSDVKSAYHAKIEAEEKAEKERIERECKEKILVDRRIEFAEYRQFSDFELSIDTTEGEYKKAIEEAVASKEVYEKKQDEIREKNVELEKAAKIEEEKRKQAEDELRKQKEDELRRIKEREEAEKIEKDRIEKERMQKELAPDKEKIKDYIDRIENLECAAVKDRNARELVNKIDKELVELAMQSRDELGKL